MVTEQELMDAYGAAVNAMERALEWIGEIESVDMHKQICKVREACEVCSCHW
jgi:hypothetical protein